MFRKATFSFRNSGIASFEDISTYLHTRNKVRRYTYEDDCADINMYVCMCVCMCVYV